MKKVNRFILIDKFEKLLRLRNDYAIVAVWGDRADRNWMAKGVPYNIKHNIRQLPGVCFFA